MTTSGILQEDVHDSTCDGELHSAEIYLSRGCCHPKLKLKVPISRMGLHDTVISALALASLRYWNVMVKGIPGQILDLIGIACGGRSGKPLLAHARRGEVPAVH